MSNTGAPKEIGGKAGTDVEVGEAPDDAMTVMLVQLCCYREDRQ